MTFRSFTSFDSEHKGFFILTQALNDIPKPPRRPAMTITESLANLMRRFVDSV